jgi:hypothetical protein
MVHVLLGYVGVVPDDFLFESPRDSIMLDLPNVRANNAFKGLKHRARPNAF